MRFFKILRVSLILLVLWLAGLAWFVDQIILVHPKIDKSDAIVVLTGAKGRIDIGIKLLVDKYADHLFVSGVGQNAILNDLSKYLDLFTPEQVNELKHAITLGHSANSTEENAIETLEWLNKHNYKKIILVTSNYHTPRSLYLFQAMMPDVIITPYPLVVSSINIRLVFLEYNKYLWCLVSSLKVFK